jgi:hypothetical protein
MQMKSLKLLSHGNIPMNLFHRPRPGVLQTVWFSGLVIEASVMGQEK